MKTKGLPSFKKMATHDDCIEKNYFPFPCNTIIAFISSPVSALL